MLLLTGALSNDIKLIVVIMTITAAIILFFGHTSASEITSFIATAVVVLSPFCVM